MTDPIPALLVVWSGTRAMSRIVLGSGDVVLGRSLLPDSDDQRISREHARFAFTSRQWTVTDLGSRNGTFVDGDTIEPHGAVPVRPFGVVRAGHTIAIPIDDASAFAATEHVVSLPGVVAGRSTSALNEGLVDAARDGLHVVIGGHAGSGREHLAKAYAQQLAPRPVRIACDPNRTDLAVAELLDAVARDPDLRLVVTQNRDAFPFLPALDAFLRERNRWFVLPPLRQRPDEIASLMCETVASIDDRLVCHATLLEYCLLAKDHLATLVNGLIDMARIVSDRAGDRAPLRRDDLKAAMQRNWVRFDRR